MKNLTFLLFVLFIGSSYNTQGQSHKLKDESSTLSVYGTSTLHDWKLNADSISGSANFDMNAKEIKEISAFRLVVPVAPMHSGLDALDKHMRTAMMENNSTVVTFILSKINSLEKNTIGGYTVQADGVITIIKNPKPVTLQATIEMLPDGDIRIFGETMLSMTDFSVEPPQAEMGTIKTENGVIVVFDVVMVKQ